MHMNSIRRGLLLTILGAGTAVAQPPAPNAGQGSANARRAANPAQHFLAHTAQLQLNDQQVTRLAAIARRAESRQQARRALIDSMRSRWITAPADSASRVTRRAEIANTMRAAMQRARDERHADLRDALAVLTADQQARAWELRSGSGRGARLGARGRGARAARGGQLRRPEMRRDDSRPRDQRRDDIRRRMRRGEPRVPGSRPI